MARSYPVTYTVAVRLVRRDGGPALLGRYYSGASSRRAAFSAAFLAVRDYAIAQGYGAEDFQGATASIETEHAPGALFRTSTPSLVVLGGALSLRLGDDRAPRPFPDWLTGKNSHHTAAYRASLRARFPLTFPQGA